MNTRKPNQNIQIDELKKELIQYILKTREEAANTIIKYWKSRKIMNITRKAIVLKKLLETRIKMVKLLQKCRRECLQRRQFDKIKNEELNFNFRVFYPNKANKVQIKIFDFDDKPCVIYDLPYCIITRSHQIYLKKDKLQKDLYFFQFIVDGFNTINPDFPSKFDHEGNYFNVIDKKTHLKRIKADEEFKNNHFWRENRQSRRKFNTSNHLNSVPVSEKFKKLHFKLSLEEIKLNDDIDEKDEFIQRRGNRFNTNKELTTITFSPKPILRKNSSKQGLGKKVSFSDIVQFQN